MRWSFCFVKSALKEFFSKSHFGFFFALHTIGFYSIMKQTEKNKKSSAFGKGFSGDKVIGRTEKKRHCCKLGLALSGGGTKGIAHIGVFKAFAEAEVPVFCVAGTSAGSIVGAAFCAGISWEQMAEYVQKFTKKDFLNKRWMIGSDSKNISAQVRKILGDKDSFDKLSVPFAAVAVNLQSGEEVVLREGDVALATAASSSVPILFKPTVIDGQALVDGGLLNNMPADVCRMMGAEVVVGVDLNYARGKGTASSKMLDTAIAAWNITTKNSMLKGQMNSDIIIAPELSSYKNTTLDFVAERIEQGYIAAMEQIPHIKELLYTKF